MHKLFFLLTFALLCSCLPEPDTISFRPQGFQSDDEFFPTVVPDLRPLYILFEEEAAERGLDFNLTELGITGNIVELGDNSILGVCVREPGEYNRVAIDIDAWINSSPEFRELIVFHELGHCVLERDHFDDDVDGICVSIMNSGLSGCEFILDDEIVREEYLDELFLY